MNWFQPVDLYCERIDTRFWAEPVNALSNGAFLLAALWALIELRKRPSVDALAVGLIALAAAIGGGSLLFHTFATRWAELTDVIPVWTFVAVYVVASILRLIRPKPPSSLAGGTLTCATLLPAVWFLSTANPSVPEHAVGPLNGSLQYAPAILGLAGFALLLARRQNPATAWAVAATTTFVLALVFRTVDRDVCAALPIGTHFLWHLLMGGTVALLLQALLRIAPQTEG